MTQRQVLRFIFASEVFIERKTNASRAISEKLWYPIPGNGQDQDQWGFEQPDPVRDTWDYGKRVGTSWFVRSLSTQAFLWFYDLRWWVAAPMESDFLFFFSSKMQQADTGKIAWIDEGIKQYVSEFSKQKKL